MKYALIVMLAVYLLTFGCNPKTEEEKTAGHETTEHAVVAEAPVAPAQLHVETKTDEPTIPEAGPSNHWNVGTQKAPAPPANVQVKTDEKAVPSEATAADDTNKQYKNIAQTAASTVLALMNDDSKGAPAPAKDEVTVLPCGKAKPQGGAVPPCMKNGAPFAKQPAAPAEDAELSQAMQKMVNATNDMATVTRQLVIATQQMLAASKEVAVEVIDTGKGVIETSKPAVQNAINEKEIIETVKEVVSATKEAFEATSKALSNAIEAKEAQPAPEVTPQQ